MDLSSTSCQPAVEKHDEELVELLAKQATILVVDDSPAMRSEVRAALESLSFGCNFVEAANGVQGIKALTVEHPDLVVCDMNMPELNGVSFLRLKASTPGRYVPVIMLTSEATVSDKVTALRAGAADYVLKPFAPEELAARVTAQLRLKRLQDMLEQRNLELKQEMQQRAAMESELRLAHKLEAVGQLAAGIAHEINTPVQFVSDSVHFLESSFEDLHCLVAVYRSACELSRQGKTEEAMAAVTEAEEAADVAYLKEQVPKALIRTFGGLERIAKIVRAMKEFSHPEQRDFAAADLNSAVATTLTIATNEYKYVAEVETDFGELPLVECLEGDINQVILNLVVNAAHAIGDVVKGTANKGKIRVSTHREGDDVVIAVSDTGGGIPEDIRHRVFDPFFTTKEVGKGTGQGLHISRKIVVDKHGGSLTFDSEVGKGTTFYVRIPISALRRESAGRAA